MLGADQKKEDAIQFPGPGPGEVNRASRNSKFRADCWGEEEAPAAKLRTADLYSTVQYSTVQYSTVQCFHALHPDLRDRCLTRPLPSAQSQKQLLNQIL